MISVRPIFRIALPLVVALLWGCGGAGGSGIAAVTPGGGGIGGTGVVASGAINGFGSIYVNGVEFGTGEAEILVDGRSAGEDALRLGMVVLVSGTVAGDGASGTAMRVVFDNDVLGPVQTVVRAEDGDSMLVTVLGVRVIVERTGTVFDGPGFGFDTLAAGDLVEVSGFPEADGRLRATRIEKKGAFVPGSSEVRLQGVVSGLAGSSFTLGAFTVDASGADLSVLPGAVVSEGQGVAVRGTLDGDAISASRVEPASAVSSALQVDEALSVAGTITGFVSAADFRVNGIAVDGSAAVRWPEDLVLADGRVVEAEGTWDGQVLRAERLEARRGRVEIEAAVAAIDLEARTLTLQLAGGRVTVVVDSRTLLDDETESGGRLTLAGIRSGDFLEVEALQVGDSLVATHIDRDEAGDDRLQAPVESFVPGTSITLLGLTYSTGAAEFRNLANTALTADQFYAAVQAGLLVKVRDRRPADGAADRVDFEYEDALDGEYEFDDDGDHYGGANDDGNSSDDEMDSEDSPDEADSPDEVDGPDEVDAPDEIDEPDAPDEPEEPNQP